MALRLAYCIHSLMEAKTEPLAAAIVTVAGRLEMVRSPSLAEQVADSVIAGIADGTLHFGQRIGCRLGGAWLWCAAVPLLGPVAVARYDVIPTLAAVAGLGLAPAMPFVSGLVLALAKRLPSSKLLSAGLPRILVRPPWSARLTFALPKS